MILVAILTRANPVGLTTLVGALHGLAQSPADITYVIRYDDDDEDAGRAASGRAIESLFYAIPNIIPMRRPRPLTLGAAWNEALNRPLIKTWDIAIPLPDDIIPLCDAWDSLVTLAANELPAFSWSQTLNPTLPMYPVVTRKYYTATQRHLFPEWFPFWESDRWVWETHHLALGRPLPIVSGLTLGGKHPGTRNMRDVPFWFEFYDATRNDRVREAAQIRAHFPSTPSFDIDTIVKMQEKTYRLHMARADLYQASNNPNPGPPSPEYLGAKARAEAYLADRP